MPSKRPTDRFNDIIYNIDAIARYTAGMTERQFLADTKTFDATQHCLLRISEAATLQVGAIDTANLLLRIIGKGDKDRRVPLPQPMLHDLRKLWRTHRHPRWRATTSTPGCSRSHAANVSACRSGNRSTT